MKKIKYCLMPHIPNVYRMFILDQKIQQAHFRNTNCKYMKKGQKVDYETMGLQFEEVENPFI